MKLDKDERSFFVPNNYSPVRTVRLRFHPTEPRLIAQVSDRRLAVWNLDAKAETVKGQKEPVVVPIACCEHDAGWIAALAVHPSGKWLITGGTDRRLRKWAWDAKPAAKPDLDIDGHMGWIEAAAFSPDGKIVATAGGDLRVRLWDSDTLKPVVEIAGHSRPIRDVIWSPDGKWLLSGAEDGKVLVHDATGSLVRTLEFGNVNEQQGQDPAQSGVFRLATSPDAKWLAVMGQNRLALYSVESGTLAAAENLSFDAAFHPAGGYLIAGQDWTKVFRLDAETLRNAKLDPTGKGGKATAAPGETITTLKRNGFGIAFSPDGKLLAAATGESTVGFWKVTLS